MHAHTKKYTLGNVSFQSTYLEKYTTLKGESAHSWHMAESADARIPADATESQAAEITRLLSAMPATDILAGLRFAYNRMSAKDAGELKVGRKNLIQGEVHAVTPEQARWRLENWKTMITEYRRKGYSYPSISRIKKLLTERACEPDVE